MLGRSLKTGEQGEKEIKVKGTNKEEKKKKNLQNWKIGYSLCPVW